MNIFDFVVDQKDVLENAIAFSKKISVNAPLSIASIKRSINAFEKSQSIDNNEYNKIKESIIKAAESSDYLEAQDAFKSKRAPKFTGK